MAVEAYLYSNCTSCKNADAMLKERGVDAARRDLFKSPLDADEIRALFMRGGVTPAEMLSRRSRPFSELGLAEQALSDDEIVELMALHPALIRRPLIVANGKAFVGFNRGKFAEFIDDTSEKG